MSIFGELQVIVKNDDITTIDGPLTWHIIKELNRTKIKKLPISWGSKTNLSHY